MPVGQVKSFSVQKGYGFIADEKESYFFHISDLPKEIQADEVRRGDFFSFDDVPGPKGMQAKKLIKAQQNTSLQLRDNFVVRREAMLKHGEVVLRVPIKSPFYKDPQKCRDTIINGAIKVGCNAVLGLTVQRETWSKGNYKHTMHWADGDLCLVAESKVCSLEDVQFFVTNLQGKIATTEMAASSLVKDFQSKRFWQKFPWGFIAVLLIFSIVFVVANS